MKTLVLIKRLVSKPRSINLNRIQRLVNFGHFYSKGSFNKKILYKR